MKLNAYALLQQGETEKTQKCDAHSFARQKGMYHFHCIFCHVPIDYAQSKSHCIHGHPPTKLLIRLQETSLLI